MGDAKVLTVEIWCPPTGGLLRLEAICASGDKYTLKRPSVIEALRALADQMLDREIRFQVEGELHAAGITEDPDLDGGLLG